MAAKQPPGPESPQDAAPDQPADNDKPTPSRQRVGEYLEETPRTYRWPDGPQSVELGDVVVLPEDWENDGRFGSTSKKPTRLRDNDPDQFPATSKRQSETRLKVHRAIAEQDKAQRAEGGEPR